MITLRFLLNIHSTVLFQRKSSEEENEIDKQEHLLHCNITKDIDTSKVKYSDIFGSLPQQIEIAKTMKRISDIREHSRKSSSLKEARCI